MFTPAMHFNIVPLLSLWLCWFATAEEDKLLFVQSAWRHGDRTPTRTCPGDPNQEDSWAKYGGFGQLTPRGMGQHVYLGDLIYQKYAVQEKFFSSKYAHNELYIRSTDLNRTMISAVSNMVGMYYNRTVGVPGVDYPEDVLWPENYVPIPIHTVINYNDYVGNPDVYCPRQTWIWQQAEKTPEIIKLRKENEDFMANLTAICGEHIDVVDNLWIFKDAFLVEQLYNKQPPVSYEDYARMVEVNGRVEDMQNGMDLSKFNGINFLEEIGKIRGGGVLWEMIRHIDLKLHCLEEGNAKNTECKWIGPLKYYAYSVHDTTVGALLTVVGVKQYVVASGYPAYSSALIVELWKSANGPCLKFQFHRNFTSEFEDVTSHIPDCKGATCCPYKEFRERSKPYYHGDEEKLCEDVSSTSTYFDPDGEGEITSSAIPPDMRTSASVGSVSVSSVGTVGSTSTIPPDLATTSSARASPSPLIATTMTAIAVLAMLSIALQ